MKMVFTTGQVAKICQVSPRTVVKWFDAGKLGGYKIPGSDDRRIPRECLIGFLQQNGMPLGSLAEEGQSQASSGWDGQDQPPERERTTVKRDAHNTELERKLDMDFAELELSVRATNCLEAEGITTIRDLVIRTDDELLRVPNFGETTLLEVKGKLAEHGLHLGMKLPPPSPPRAGPPPVEPWEP